MASNFSSHLSIKEISLFGVLIISAQIGKLSINIAERSPKYLFPSLSIFLLPPNLKDFPENKFEFSLLFIYKQRTSLPAL